jgi:hypothetical protein
MILLSGTLEQRLVGRILDEGMLEEIGRVWQQATLVEYFRFEEPSQFTL